MYLEPNWTSAMVLFLAKILNGFMLLTIFAKKAPSQSSTALKLGFWFLAKSLKYWAHSCSQPSLQIKTRKYSHCFCKNEWWRWDSKQNKYLCRSSRAMSSVKFRKIHKKTSVPGSYLFNKVKLCRSTTSLKMRDFWSSVFLWILRNL